MGVSIINYSKNFINLLVILANFCYYTFIKKEINSKCWNVKKSKINDSEV